MTQRKLTDAEALTLWREAERRLRLVDPAPPLETTQVDALLEVLGPRRPDESLRDWLRRSQAPAAPEQRPAAEVIPFSPRRQRFVPVAEITRLAADTAGARLELPARDLETADGRFRLKVSSEGNQVVIAVQTLGLAADQFAGKLIGLAAAEGAEPTVVLQLDQDGDGEVRLPDSDELRRALLNPVLGTIEDL
jgi:hypothetical protein